MLVVKRFQKLIGIFYENYFDNSIATFLLVKTILQIKNLIVKPSKAIPQSQK